MRQIIEIEIGILPFTAQIDALPFVLYIQEFSHAQPRYLLIWNALVKLPLKVVDSDDSKHEEEEKHHDDNMTDIFEGNRDSLDGDLEVLIG